MLDWKSNFLIRLSSRFLAKTILVLGWFILLSTSIQAQKKQTPNISSLKKITIHDGLAINCLESGLIDRNGKIWLNPCEHTALGLGFSFFQFDGSKSIFYDIGKKYHHSDKRVYQWKILGELPDGTFYGHSYSSSRYGTVFFLWHPETDEIEFHPLEKSEYLLAINSNEQNEVYALTFKDNNYLIYGKKNGKWKVISSMESYLKNDRLFYPPYEFIIRGNEAWFLNQDEGLIRADLEQGKMDFHSWSELGKDMPIRTDEFAFCCNTQSWKITEAPNGDFLFYLGPLNGFFTFNTESLELKPFSHLNSFSSLPSENGKFRKVYFSRDQFDNLLIISGSFAVNGSPQNDYEEFMAWIWSGDGSWIDISKSLEAERSNLMMYGKDLPRKFFGYNFLQEVCWMTQDGINILDVRPELGIDVFRFDEKSNGVRSIGYIGENQLLVNTDFEKLMVLDLKTGSFNTVRLPGMPDVWPLSKMIIREHLAYVAARGGILLSFDFNSGTYEEYSIGFHFTKFTFLDPSRIIIASQTGRLYLLDITTKALSKLQPSDTSLEINSEITDLKVLNDDLVVISALNGLWQLNLKTLELKHFNEINPILGESILTISPGNDAELWLGTAKRGILIFNTQSNSLAQVSKVNGLSNNTVVGILTDAQGYNWASTYSGISVLDGSGKVLFSLTESSGLSNNEFNRTSYFKLSGGKLAFGGIDGLNIINPSPIIENLSRRSTKNIYVTSLEYYNKETASNQVDLLTYDKKTPYNIHPEHNFIGIDFAMSSYVGSKNYVFAYRLIPKELYAENYDDIPWIGLGSHSELLINDLPVGEHTIQIKGIDQYSNKVIKPLEILVSVDNFFYRTWWFFALCGILISGVIFVYIRRIQTEHGRLKVEVEKRTTQIRKSKETIEKQAQLLSDLDQAKSHFFTNISHEFRTPLTVILGLIEQSDGQERVKKLITRNAKLLLNLVNQILELRKLESGNISKNLIQSDIIAFIQYIIESFHSLAESKDVSVIFKADQDHFIIDYDADKIMHIVSNLLSNAIKFTPPEGKVLVTFKTSVDTESSFYEIVVADTGTGIPEDKIEHIFDRFYQVDDEVSRTGSGTGVGLTLVKELTNFLGGNIEVESGQGTGAIFKVSLPITNSGPIMEESPIILNDRWRLIEPMDADLEVRVRKQNQALPSLLVVEDNPDVKEYLMTCLQDDYNLMLASDGQEGLEMAMDKVPDLILSDVMMPKMDGFTLCDHLKTDQRTSHIPVVLLTAKADLDSRIQGLQHGADAYLAKPFDKRELTEQLKNLLLLRRRLQERYSSLENIAPSNELSVKKEDEFMLQLKETILAHMADDGFGVSELCEKVFMSRTQLHNKIKSLTNRSTSHLIRLVRMEKACELLRETDLNVSQISSEVGIESLPYFSRIFKEEIGFSPNKYKENYSN